MRITEAARRLGTSPRMLRYRETLGLLPPTREHGDSPRPAKPPGHRRFGEPELRAVALALELEKRYDISPAELAFGLRVLAEPDVRARVRDLGERIGRVSAPPVRALDFEKEKALRWLGRRAGSPSPAGRSVTGPSPRR
jgi:MerR family copper efflux transcriptional regulator